MRKSCRNFVSTCFKKPGFPIFHYNHKTKQNKKSFWTHFAYIANITRSKESACSKFQRKMIISTWQIGNKLIIKNYDITSKNLIWTNHINFEQEMPNWIQLLSWDRIWKTFIDSWMSFNVISFIWPWMSFKWNLKKLHKKIFAANAICLEL